MGHIKVHEFTTLDGVVAVPTWTAPYGFPDAMAAAIDAITQTCTGILLGRTTYEMFAPAWSQRTAEDDPGAPFFNDTPKHVVSATLTDPGWGPLTVIDGYDPAAIAVLKERSDGDLYVSGSATLVRAMLADGLVDELNLLVYPVAIGEGVRLFRDGDPAIALTLTASRVFDNGVVHLTYGPAAARTRRRGTRRSPGTS